MFEQKEARDSRSSLTDWLLRGAIAAAFVMFGAEKFTDPQWVKLFQQIGFGQWFRVFTGVVEIVGGLLVLVPRAATVGLGLLACTMASATLILGIRAPSAGQLHHYGSVLRRVGAVLAESAGELACRARLLRYAMAGDSQRLDSLLQHFLLHQHVVSIESGDRENADAGVGQRSRDR